LLAYFLNFHEPSDFCLHHSLTTLNNKILPGTKANNFLHSAFKIISLFNEINNSTKIGQEKMETKKNCEKNNIVSLITRNLECV
ncbi:MAG: hypothetical protein K9I68_08915, partial [Bacteroidales bacterium]|nr:hypothetical protein [Bacteroidales bacterium]